MRAPMRSAFDLGWEARDEQKERKAPWRLNGANACLAKQWLAGYDAADSEIAYLMRAQ